MTDTNCIKTIRVSNIESIIALNIKFDLNNEILKKLRKIKETFDPFLGEEETIKLKLSDKGVILYNRILHNRPVVEKIELDYYYFKCPVDKIYIYFFKFGQEVEVIEPLALRERFLLDYQNALRVYIK